MRCKTAMLNMLSVLSQPLIKRENGVRGRRGEGKESDIAVKYTCLLPHNSPDGCEYSD